MTDVIHFCPTCGKSWECLHLKEIECQVKRLCDQCREAQKLEERYALAAKIVRLIEDLQRELNTGYGYGGVNWNHAVVNGFTDSLENLILGDIFGPLRPPLSGAKAVRTEEQERIARERIGILFQQHRLLVAELELSGLNYRGQA